MKISLNTVVFVVVLIITSAITSGCATRLVDLVDAEKVEVELVSSKYAYFTKLAVYSTESGVTVSGAIKKHIPSRARIPGYVQIIIITPDESVLAEVTTGYRRRSRKSTTCIFSVDIPQLVPEGSTVRAIHHTDRTAKGCSFSETA